MTEPWLSALLLPDAAPNDGDGRKSRLTWMDGVLRDNALVDIAQAQTRDIFAFKWSKQDTYKSEAMNTAISAWLHDRYGDLLSRVGHVDQPIVLDAGCGAGNAADLLFGDRLRDLTYVGVDISQAVDLARDRIAPKAARSAFVQADLQNLPFQSESFDVVISEGVLHHTPSAKGGFLGLSKLLKPKGIAAIYVYIKKAPVREFVDDHVRNLISDLPSEQAWEKLMPLTRLGKALGDIDVDIKLPEDIEVLGIPAGTMKLQRLFYYFFCKAFYRPELTLDEMNHINFDWYMPKYCSRHTPEEMGEWCREAGLALELLKPEESGITMIARKAIGQN